MDAFFECDEDGILEDHPGDNYIQKQEGIIFLVILTNLFEEDLFTKCLQTYYTILKQKCSTNSNDKMGLFLCGTQESNENIEHVTLLQDFNSISVDSLKIIKDLVKNGGRKYQNFCNNKFSLCDIILYAMQRLVSSGTNKNTILLFTENDNPYCDDVIERSRIQNSILALKDSDIKFRVVGLSKDWNSAVYYKNLELLAGTFNSDDDYHPTNLENLEYSVISPYRRICTLPWVFSSEIKIPVSIFVTNAISKYPTKIKLEKETNKIVETIRNFQVENTNQESEQMYEQRIIRNENLVYYKTYGGMDICFKANERTVFANLDLNPIIEILACKEIDSDPSFHMSAPNFVTTTKSCPVEDKQFFNMFINGLANKNLMAICKVATKFKVFICQMIPEKESSGLYLFKIPYSENIRDLNALDDYIFNSNQSNPINLDAVQIYKELIQLSTVESSMLHSFTNPKLEKMTAHIEALALDERLGPLPKDSTIPPPINDEFKRLSKKLHHIFYTDNEEEQGNLEQLNVKKKKRNINIQDFAERHELSSLTVVELKDFLKSINLTASGTKTTLIARINQHFNL